VQFLVGFLRFRLGQLVPLSNLKNVTVPSFSQTCSFSWLLLCCFSKALSKLKERNSRLFLAQASEESPSLNGPGGRTYSGAWRKPGRPSADEW
jgi:hypothetical protein